MSNECRIPDSETRARSVAKLRQLVERMDRHIADLDELNARLEADFQNKSEIFYSYLLGITYD